MQVVAMASISHRLVLFVYVGVLGFVFLCTQTWIEPRLRQSLNLEMGSYLASSLSSLIAIAICFIVGCHRLFGQNESKIEQEKEQKKESATDSLK